MNHARACEAAERLRRSRVRLVNDSFFNEFTLKLPSRRGRRCMRMVERAMLGGVSLGGSIRASSALQNGLVVAVTETVTDEDIARWKRR
jgi:glycine dehydrogenase subunit 1